MNTDQHHQIAGQVRQALTGLGHCYQTQDGQVVEVAFRSIRANDRWLLLEVDTNRLPRRVSIPALETPSVLTHLSAVVHRPVSRLNTVGLSYCIDLDPQPKQQRSPLPRVVDLPPSPDGLSWAWPFGRDRDGLDVWRSLATTSHLLVGGKSGSGKTSFIHAGLVALLRRHGPDELRLVLVDPKVVELTQYAGLPHLGDLGIATDPGQAAQAASWLAGEVERRQALFASVGARSLRQYNSRDDVDPLPLALGVFDEFIDLSLSWGVKSQPFAELIRVASKGRAFGVLLLLSTQHPRSDVIDSLARENAGVRVALKVDTVHQSRAILGVAGAECIPSAIPGRLGVLGLGDGLRPLQGFHVDDATINATVERWRSATPSPLSSAERSFVEYAVERLDGRFNLQALYDVHKGTDCHLSWRQVRALGQRWELRGWLSPGVDATSARTVTPELLRLTGQGRAAV